MNTYIREIVDKTNLLQSYQSEEGTLINVEIVIEFVLFCVIL